jgi:hypothetical protein
MFSHSQRENLIMPSRGFALAGASLISFDLASPNNRSTIGISGIVAGQTLVGIDFRPLNGLLYALGVNATADTATLYTISTIDGHATAVGSPAGLGDLPSGDYGFDFNPAVDRIRVTTASGRNFRLNPDNGTLAATDPNIVGSAISGAAYTNNTANSGNITTLYTLDSLSDQLMIQNPANAGTQNPVGSVGVDFSTANGFDIPAGVNAPSSNAVASGTGIALLTLTASSATGLYTINLATGAATLVGSFSSAATVNGLAISRPAKISSDFNGDSTSDVLWRNDSSGHVGTWEMHNGALTWHDLGGSGVDHKAVGIGDFNADGTLDVLWRNDSSGHVGTWEMHNNVPTWHDLGSSGVDHRVAGIGDFNGDGTSDVLWRNDSSGHVGTWEMHNNVPTWHDLGGSGVDHKVAGIGDFNGDGTSDILWRNDSSGHVGIWAMQNNSPTWLDLGGSGVDHKVVGIGDFNGDGISDVLWRNDSSGHVGTWEMHNNVPTWHDLGGSGVDHKVAAIGDFNGDGTSDILWRNDSSGHVGWWEMHNGTQTWHDLGSSGADHLIIA